MKFFVYRLESTDNRVKAGVQFEIQIVDESGLATSVGYLEQEQEALEIDGINVPTAVLDAARKQPVGKGDFVNSEGKSVLP